MTVGIIDHRGTKLYFLPLSFCTTPGDLHPVRITTNKETRASESKEETLSPEKRGFHKCWATNLSSSFLTSLTSCKADKVGTLFFTLRLGIITESATARANGSRKGTPSHIHSIFKPTEGLDDWVTSEHTLGKRLIATSPPPFEEGGISKEKKKKELRPTAALWYGSGMEQRPLLHRTR